MELKDLYKIPQAYIDYVYELFQIRKNLKKDKLYRRYLTAYQKLMLQLSLRQKLFFENKYKTVEELEEMYIDRLKSKLKSRLRSNNKPEIIEELINNAVNKEYEKDYANTKFKTDEDFYNYINKFNFFKSLAV